MFQSVYNNRTYTESDFKKSLELKISRVANNIVNIAKFGVKLDVDIYSFIKAKRLLEVEDLHTLKCKLPSFKKIKILHDHTDDIPQVINNIQNNINSTTNVNTVEDDWETFNL